jgi:uncharacterized spore protein YtfJ
MHQGEEDRNMKIDEVLESARDAVTVKRVFGEPFEKDGLTVIPAARVAGGGGGGSGTAADGEGGEGGGFGLAGRPAGAYVIQDGEVHWRPALDPNRIIAVVGAVVVAFLLTRPRLIRARAKAAGTE